ncbi:MAG: hypothetical protein AAFZ91_01810 [Pseudomonadota bacterium]
MARSIPTDKALLAEIYKHYLRDFSAHTEENKIRQTKIWVPIDIDRLGRKFRTDPDLIFGRLYYHFNGKFASSTGDGESVSFFHMRMGADKHVVNFPLLTSVLADLQDDQKRFVISTRMAALSLIVSSVSIIIAVFL